MVRGVDVSKLKVQADTILTKVESMEAALDDVSLIPTQGTLTNEQKNTVNTTVNTVVDTLKEDKEVDVKGLALATFGGEILTKEATVSLDVTQKPSVESSLMLEIKPYVTVDGSTSVIPNADIKTPITFKVYIPDDFSTQYIDVIHKFTGGGQENLKLPIQTDDVGSFIVITVTKFSEFELIPHTDSEGTSPTTYALTVNNGSGDASYASGATVAITADTAPSGKQFKNWTTSNGGTFANVNSANTTFTMPSNAVTLTAHYEDIYLVEGNNQIISLGSTDDVVFRINRDITDFDKLKLGASVIDREHYTIKSGSIILTLKGEYVKTLPVGTHVFKACVGSEEIDLNLQVKSDSIITSPQTGDNNSVLIPMVIMIVSLCGIIGAIFVFNKRKKNLE